MKLDELLAHLNIARKTYGNVDCFCNGEYGIYDIKFLEVNDIATGSVEDVHGDEGLLENKSTQVVHIGGY